jgi:uncharacterized protein
MAEAVPWSVRSLKSALESSPMVREGEFKARIVEGADPILLVTMCEYGDLEIFVSAGEQQVAASVLLWPVEEQADRHAFNEFLLKAQKLVPLSNFGITTVDGRDFYELFGELSTTTSLDDIVIELRTLAENAIEAAEDLRGNFSGETAQ